MVHEDYEREHLKDQVYLKEAQMAIELEYQQWLQGQAKIVIEDDTYKETRPIAGDGAGHEPLFSDSLPSEWDEGFTLTSKDEISSPDTRKEGNGDTGRRTISPDQRG